MISILHQAPREEPLSVGELRAHLHTDDADEVLLQSLISSARMTIEARSGMRLITQHWHILLNDWGRADEPILLPHYPVHSIDAIRLLDEPPQIVAPSLYRLQEGTRPAELHANWSLLPRVRRKHYGIQIELTAGYGAPAQVPENLRLAVRTLAAYWYDLNDWNQHQAEQTIPATVRTLIEPHARVRL